MHGSIHRFCTTLCFFIISLLHQECNLFELLSGYRARPDEQFCEKEKHPASHAASDYENIQQMNDYSDTMSR